MTAIAFGAAIILTAITCYLWGHSDGSRKDISVKRTNSQMNADEANRANERRASAEASLARYYLKQIVDGLDGQQSGAAVKAVRLAKQGLGL